MKTARIQSRCECQSKLSALVVEDGTVIQGRVITGSNTSIKVPAIAIGAGQPQFQVGWQCAVCGRNTLRSFFRGALVFSQAS